MLIRRRFDGTHVPRYRSGFTSGFGELTCHLLTYSCMRLICSSGHADCVEAVELPQQGQRSFCSTLLTAQIGRSGPHAAVRTPMRPPLAGSIVSCTSLCHTQRPIEVRLQAQHRPVPSGQPIPLQPGLMQRGRRNKWFRLPQQQTQRAAGTTQAVQTTDELVRLCRPLVPCNNSQIQSNTARSHEPPFPPRVGFRTPP